MVRSTNFLINRFSRNSDGKIFVLADLDIGIHLIIHKHDVKRRTMFLIRLISKSKASFSDPVTINSKSRIWETSFVVLLLCTP